MLVVVVESALEFEFRLLPDLGFGLEVVPYLGSELDLDSEPELEVKLKQQVLGAPEME